MSTTQVGSERIGIGEPDRLGGISVDSLNPAHEAIARRAYELWEARGRPHGSPEEDWFRAQNELRTGSGDLAAENAFCKF